MSSLITLTTDFGDASPYVAVMKGVILSLNPAARLLDLSHRVRAQDVRHADYFLGTAVPYFPKGTVHVAVVDPGVGSDRHPLVIEAGGQLLVDEFGNLITNIHAAHWKSHSVRATVGGADPVPVRWVRTYSDATAGELVSLISSDGFVEFAVVQGSAALRLGAEVGTPVELHLG